MILYELVIETFCNDSKNAESCGTLVGVDLLVE